MQVQSEACMQCKVVMLGSASTGKTSIIRRQVNNTFDYHVKPTLGAGLSFTIIKVDPNSSFSNLTKLQASPQPFATSSSLADLSTNSTILPNSSLNKNSNKTSSNKIDVKLNIWDTAGQENYRSLARIYYRDSQAAIIVFDVTNKNSFNDVGFWINELRSLQDKCSIFIVGNKIDLSEASSNNDDELKEDENQNKQDVITETKEIENEKGEDHIPHDRQVSYEQGFEFAKRNNAFYFETSAKTGKGVAELFEAVANRFVITKRDPNLLKRSASSTTFSSSSKKNKRSRNSTDDNSDDNDDEIMPYNSGSNKGVINFVDTNNADNSEKNGNRSNCCS